MSEDEPLPYDEVTDTEYAEKAAAEFTIDTAGYGTLLLRGPCPRCRAVIEVPVVDRVLRDSRSITLPWTGRRRQEDHVEPMICLCVDSHPGRPDGRIGCGAYWTLLIPGAGK